MNPRRNPTEPSRPDPIGSDLRELFRAGAPAEPSEAEWSATLDGVRRGLARPRVMATPVARRWGLGALVAAAFAAAAAVALALAIPYFRVAPSDAVEEVADVVQFPVTDAEDVEILSVDTADSGAIVVGDLPLRRPIVFMEPGDVALRSLQRDAEGDFPDVHMHHEGEESPMIWAPLSLKP
jgi:hypothetical protein